ncbi:MAG: NADH-quinone oxidoreductase subunit C [Candidatus Omnitrophica bacterium]|nr:NADH-quinone oxidoreductase subunit C [Candidatus Omnitrophota bacterium]
MGYSRLKEILEQEKVNLVGSYQPYPDEIYLTVSGGDFAKLCRILHKQLNMPVMMLFAEDLRATCGKFALYCVFLNEQECSWIIARQDIPADKPVFTSLANDIYSVSLFEREIKEMFGITPVGHPDLRRLKLHDEVWPEGLYPLRKDFSPAQNYSATGLKYRFNRVEGEGVFEVPVGPVHAGIIGSGHFRFSVAGEPIINLEARLGWTHRGIEKLLEGKNTDEALKIFECISGDTVFGYSLAFCQCIEKIFHLDVPERARLLRALFLELERIYNHANDIGGIALDVGFTFPAQFASLIKETVLGLDEKLCGSRYLKGINAVGGVGKDIDSVKQELIRQALPKIQKDFLALEEVLFSSVSFMDRVDATGILRAKTARDLGVTGVPARASGISLDTRKVLHGIYDSLSFKVAKEQSGDVASRLRVRCKEVKESIGIIEECLGGLNTCQMRVKEDIRVKEGFAVGCAEAWRGPVRVWASINAQGVIERCKIVDPSFQNWEGLTFAVLGNIIPDFPLCNKSFDLSYSGNDL